MAASASTRQSAADRSGRVTGRTSRASSALVAPLASVRRSRIGVASASLAADCDSATDLLATVVSADISYLRLANH
jgi:hypothetical protein